MRMIDEDCNWQIWKIYAELSKMLNLRQSSFNNTKQWHLKLDTFISSSLSNPGLCVIQKSQIKMIHISMESSLPTNVLVKY